MSWSVCFALPAMAHEAQLRCIGVMETEERRGKPDFALEKKRCTPKLNPHAPQNVHLIDDVCFIPFRRQQVRNAAGIPA
jgi:hypothetical protein